MRRSLFFCAIVLSSSAFAESSYRVYVTNEQSGSVSVIDGATRNVVATLPLGKRPRGIRASPDGKKIYVALSGSPIAGPGVDESSLPLPEKAADGIGVVAVATGRVEKILRGVSDPEQLAVAPDGTTLFVASEDTGRAVVIDSHGGTVINTVAVGGEPEGVAVSPDGRSVYVTSETDNCVVVFGADDLRERARIPVGQRPRGIAFSPDGARVYVSGENDASLTLIDTAAQRVLQTLILPGPNVRPMGIAVAADGKRIYIASGRGGSVIVVDAREIRVIAQIPVGPRPWGLALSPDGKFLYSANGPSNDVSIIDTAALSVIGRVPVGERPWGVAVVQWSAH